MRLIDADAYIDEINKRIKEAHSWYDEVSTDEMKARAEQAIVTFCEASLTAKKMPSVEKTGKWIIEIEEVHTEKYDARIPHWFCSCCRTEYDPYFASRINYCYNCGVKLEV